MRENAERISPRVSSSSSSNEARSCGARAPRRFSWAFFLSDEGRHGRARDRAWSLRRLPPPFRVGDRLFLVSNAFSDTDAALQVALSPQTAASRRQAWPPPPSTLSLTKRRLLCRIEASGPYPRVSAGRCGPSAEAGAPYPPLPRGRTPRRRRPGVTVCLSSVRHGLPARPVDAHPYFRARRHVMCATLCRRATGRTGGGGGIRSVASSADGEVDLACTRLAQRGGGASGGVR